jgi:hypothetical protein
VDAAFRAERTIHQVMPRLEPRDEGGIDIVLPGDPSYPSAAPVAGPTRIRFAQGRWWSL